MESAELIIFIIILILLFIIAWSNSRPKDYGIPILIIFISALAITWILYSSNLMSSKYTPLIPHRTLPLPTLNSSDLDSLSSARSHIDRAIASASNEYKNSALYSSIIDSLDGGKRLRGALCLDVAYRTGQMDATEMALALEYLHAASLVIDDLPHFDNDLIRRNKPSVHAKYGAATAQMTATSLTALVMEGLIRQGDQLRQKCSCIDQLMRANQCSAELMTLISETLGMNGVSGGQLEEHFLVQGENKDLASVIHLKTAILFEAAVLSGWIVGTTLNSWSSKSQSQSIRKAAYHYGMAFQIADDIGDYLKDQQNGHAKANYAVMNGKQKAIQDLKLHLEECQSELIQLNLWSPIWEDAYKVILLLT